LSVAARPPCPPLFPYTTLFRSAQLGEVELGHQFLGPVLAGLAWHGARLQDRHQVLLDRQALEDAGLLRQVAHAALRSLVHRQARSEEHTSELQSREKLVCRLLL